MAIVGLVPAAGHGVRLAGSVEGSKETQPVRGRPVMSYLLDRLRLGGAMRVIVTTRPEKVDVAEVARAAGADVVMGHPATVGASLLLAAERCGPDDIALFGFPDSIWTPADGFLPLVDMIRAGETLALGVFETAHPERSDVTVIGRDGRLERLDIKPERPTASLIWAAGASRVATLRTLLAEAEPSDAIQRLTAVTPIATVRLGRVLDIGTPDGLRAVATDPVFDDERGADRVIRGRAAP